MWSVTKGCERKHVKAFEWLAGMRRAVLQCDEKATAEARAHRIVWEIESLSKGQWANEEPSHLVEWGSPDDPNRASAGRGL